MDYKIWLPILLTIPMSILAGLAVRPIERWYERRGKSNEAIRKIQFERDFQQTAEFIEHPHLFTQFLLRTIINLIRAFAITILGLLISIMSATARLTMSNGTKPLSHFDNYFTRIFGVIGLIGFTLGIAAFAADGREFQASWWRVVNMRKELSNRSDA